MIKRQISNYAFCALIGLVFSFNCIASDVPLEIKSLINSYYSAVQAQDWKTLEHILEPSSGLTMTQLENGYRNTFAVLDQKINSVTFESFDQDSDNIYGLCRIRVVAIVSAGDGSGSFDQELGYVVILSQKSSGWKIVKVMNTLVFETSSLLNRNIEPGLSEKEKAIFGDSADVKSTKTKASETTKLSLYSQMPAAPVLKKEEWKTVKHPTYKHQFKVPSDWEEDKNEEKGETIQVYSKKGIGVPQVRVVWFPVMKPLNKWELEGTIQASLMMGGVFKKHVFKEPVQFKCGPGLSNKFTGDFFGTPLENYQMVGSETNNLYFLAVMVEPGNKEQLEIAKKITESFTPCP